MKTRKPNGLDPDVFVRAAERFFFDDVYSDSSVSMYCCQALGHEEYGDAGSWGGAHCDYFLNLYDDGKHKGGYWDDDDTESRILALLLCSEIVKDQKRKGRGRNNQV